jgi:hypothetical protein
MRNAWEELTWMKRFDMIWHAWFDTTQIVIFLHELKLIWHERHDLNQITLMTWTTWSDMDSMIWHDLNGMAQMTITKMNLNDGQRHSTVVVLFIMQVHSQGVLDFKLAESKHDIYAIPLKYPTVERSQNKLRKSVLGPIMDQYDEYWHLSVMCGACELHCHCYTVTLSHCHTKIYVELYGCLVNWRMIQMWHYKTP